MRDFTGQRISANLWRGREAVGGKLGFDTTGMTFEAHSINVHTGTTRIEYRDIAGLDTHRTLGIINNGLAVRLTDGTEHRFVLNKRSTVIEFLTTRIRA